MARRGSQRSTEAGVRDYRHAEAERLNNPEADPARYETEPTPTRTSTTSTRHWVDIAYTAPVDAVAGARPRPVARWARRVRGR